MKETTLGCKNKNKKITNQSKENHKDKDLPGTMTARTTPHFM